MVEHNKTSNEKLYVDWWLEQNKNRQDKDIAFGELSIHVKDTVFSPDPNLTHSSTQIVEILDHNLSSLSVLDIGCGSGVISIIAAQRNAKKVTAIDTNSDCLENAKINTTRYNLEGNITIKQSDLFNNVSDKFDIIVANLPIIDRAWSKTREDITNTYDRLLNEYRDHLNDNGFLLLSYASFGDLDYIKDQFNQHQIKPTIHHHYKFGVDWFVYQIYP